MDMTKENTPNEADKSPMYFDGRRKLFEARAGNKYYPFYALTLADMARVSPHLDDKITGQVVNSLLVLATPTVGTDDYFDMIITLGPDGVFNIFSYYVSLQDFETGDIFEEKYGRLH